MYDDTISLKIDPVSPNEEQYRYKLELLERYKAATDPAEKNFLKLRIAMAKVWEIERCFNNYNDSGERHGFNELTAFLEDRTDTVTFLESFSVHRYKGDWSS